ncbi:hypothetical protein MPC1_5020002 [Methylocella tundrae]|nr:hypothetical protein MPC1_5020002 [Methylocella tundrae]
MGEAPDLLSPFVAAFGPYVERRRASSPWDFWRSAWPARCPAAECGASTVAEDF